MDLVIVESPTKSKTIKKFLENDFEVLSSGGHIRDLPKSKLGIDVEKNFKPEYLIIPKAKEIIRALKEASEKANIIYLATDPDREGEAIAWHLTQALDLDGKKPYQRIVFHEITKPAIEESFKSPRQIDMNMVDAQQTRRILDRLVGYKLSPFLWKKVARGLSAGRVQSVAVRLVVEREKEIKAFNSQEYWSIEALLNKKGKKDKEFIATLVKKDEKIIDKLDIKSKEEADVILKGLENAEYRVSNIEKKETNKNPFLPFTTSTLQQTASRKFHFSAKFTMSVAQKLYEQGLITYHRTDSVNISDLALGTAKKYIIENFGANYYHFRKFKTKSKIAQEAHEAIRPTYPENSPEKIIKLESSQVKLYDLIWKRFIASQMSSAIFDSTAIDIEAKNYTFRSTGQILKFAGFLKIYPVQFEETELPPLETNEILELKKLNPSQHFTQPPNRYGEASLIKTLEKYGIGRPSTYAPIIDTIQQRGYVEKDEKKFLFPTDIGIIVNDMLVQHFPEIVDINFTAKMEEDLDKIARDETEYLPVIKDFYDSFQDNLTNKEKEVGKVDLTERTKEICPECGKYLLIRKSRYGKFYTCSGYPKCKYKRNILISLRIKCPKCKKGEMVERKTRKRKTFYGCSEWPNCDYALWDKPTGEICPECNFLMAKTKWGRIKCSNKDCKTNKKIEKT